ncbi:MAG: MarC family protein [Rhizobiales bacterium]|nr:MarC family protein [Hyphomicrobiales bacterium]
MTDYLLNALVTLFVTIDPIGLAPMFMVVTAGFSAPARRQTAIRAAVTAAIILIAFALVGERLIAFLGISLPAFRIAGGLLLFAIAYEMVFEKRAERKAAQVETPDRADDRNHVAIFPLAIPLTSGPGAISATILLASQAPGIGGLAGLMAVIVLMVGACLAVFLAAGPIERALGETGRLVVSRLLGVLLAALSVQFVADGIQAIIRGSA